MRLTPVMLLAVACGVHDSTQTDTNAQDWSVPEGAVVTQAPPGEMVLTMETAIVGSTMTATIEDAYAYEDFHLVVSMAGEGESCPGFLGGACLGLAGELKRAGMHRSSSASPSSYPRED